jgi:acyl-CoA synthetase (AMP-forming)/AMP-acid ligase II
VLTPAGPRYTIPCEAIFRAHPDVQRAALVGIGPRDCQTPVIIVEPKPERRHRVRTDRQHFETELLALGAGSPLTAGIRQVLFHRDFPVDIRHNAKIRREALAAWAAAELNFR